MSPLAHGLRWTTLALALGAVGVGVVGVAGGRLDLPLVRIPGAPEIDVSQGPNLTPPGFDATFFAEQRDPTGHLAWRFRGRQVVAESFSAGGCSDPELVLYDQGQAAVTLRAREARLSATDPQGRAWSPGGGVQVRDVVVDLTGEVELTLGELVLRAAAGRATLVRPVDDPEGEPRERAPDAEVARLVLQGPLVVRGRGPDGAPVDARAAGATAIARGGSANAPAWVELEVQAPDGAWAASGLRCAEARGRWARLPTVAGAGCGGLAGASPVGPAQSLGSARYLLVDGALRGGVQVRTEGVTASAERVERSAAGWVARGAPARVDAAQGSWLEAPRLVGAFAGAPRLRAEGGVRGEAVAPASSSSVPGRWAFAGESLELEGAPAPEGWRLARGRLDGQASFASGASRLEAGAVEVRETAAERSLRLLGGARVELGPELARGEPLRARLDEGELRLAGDVAALGSLRASDVRALRLAGLRELAWGDTAGRADALSYRREGAQGVLSGRGVDLSLAAVQSDAAAPLEVRAETLAARLDPEALDGEAEPLVRVARALQQAELEGEAEVGRGGAEPRRLRAERIVYRGRTLTARGDATLAGASPSGRWTLEAREVRAELAQDPEVWGHTREARRWLRAHGLPFVPPPLVRELELSGQVAGELVRAGEPARRGVLSGERLRYAAETRVARLEGGAVELEGRRLEAEELLGWWTLLGEQPLVWLGARGPRLSGEPPSKGEEPSRLGTTHARAAWLNAVLYSAFGGFEVPPLWAWAAGGAEGVDVRSDGEVALRVQAPTLHGQGRELAFPGGPVTLALGDVELQATRGRLSFADEVARAELAEGWSARFALPGGDPQDPPYRARGRDLSLELDLPAATALQTQQGRADPALAQRAVRALSAEGGIEIEGPNLRAQGQAARRAPGSGVTWLEGDPAQVERGGLSYRGRRLELELR